MNSEEIRSIVTEGSSFSEREIEYLLNLIGDYTRRLRAASDSISRLQSRRIFYLLMGISIAIIAGLLWYFGLRYEFGLATTIIVITMSVLAIAIGVIGIWLVHGRMSLLRAHGEFALRMRFEDVVRLASQIEDHGAVDSIHRIALRLALADAEDALRTSRY